MIRLGVITKLWQRPALTRVFLRYWSDLRVPGVDLVRVAAVSPDEDQHVRTYTTFPEWTAVSVPNRPLSDKGNAACRTLRGKVDAVLNVGSDDFCSPTYIRMALRRLRLGVLYVSPAYIYFYDTETHRACVYCGAKGFEANGRAGAKRVSVFRPWRPGPRIGAGRVLSSRLLDRIGWEPWVSGEQPDIDMDTRLKDVPCAGIPGEVVLDVKTLGADGRPANIGSYASVRQNARPASPAPVLGRLPGLVGLLASMKGEALPC